VIGRCLIVSAVLLMGLHGTTEVSAQDEPALRASAELSGASDAPPVLRIGVRSFARPFAYKSDTLRDVLTAATPGPLAIRNYSGYMVKICDAVLNELLIDPKVPGGLSAGQIRPIDLDLLMANDSDSVGGRFRFLIGQEVDGDDIPPEIDILCDPATITNERRKNLMISPPVYLTGVSYITPDRRQSDRDLRNESHCPREVLDDPNGVSFLIGMVGKTTAVSGGIRALLDAGELPRYRDHLIKYLQDDSNCRLSEKLSQRLDRLKEDGGLAWRGPVALFQTHRDAAEAFCKGYIAYYVGDREIIAENARAVPGCQFDNSARTFTADRYAIFGRIDYDGDSRKALLVARFFEILARKILSHPSIIDQVFYDTFHPTEPTDALRLFFRSVRGAP